jgi:hypothetical protein
MRCFLPPRTRLGMELRRYLKHKHVAMKHYMSRKVITLNAYHFLYEDVEMWMYTTNILQTNYGYMYRVSLRSLLQEQLHAHVCVDVKYLPTIVEEGVCFSTMGTRHIEQWCNHSLAPPSPLCGYDYH